MTRVTIQLSVVFGAASALLYHLASAMNWSSSLTIRVSLLDNLLA